MVKFECQSFQKKQTLEVEVYMNEIKFHCPSQGVCLTHSEFTLWYTLPGHVQTSALDAASMSAQAQVFVVDPSVKLQPTWQLTVIPPSVWRISASTNS